MGLDVHTKKLQWLCNATIVISSPRGGTSYIGPTGMRRPFGYAKSRFAVLLRVSKTQFWPKSVHLRPYSWRNVYIYGSLIPPAIGQCIFTGLLLKQLYIYGCLFENVVLFPRGRDHDHVDRRSAAPPSHKNRSAKVIFSQSMRISLGHPNKSASHGLFPAKVIMMKTPSPSLNPVLPTFIFWKCWCNHVLGEIALALSTIKS